jgi:hypothetical protein
MPRSRRQWWRCYRCCRHWIPGLWILDVMGLDWLGWIYIVRKGGWGWKRDGSSGPPVRRGWLAAKGRRQHWGRGAGHMGGRAVKSEDWIIYFFSWILLVHGPFIYTPYDLTPKQSRARVLTDLDSSFPKQSLFPKLNLF